MCPNICGLAGYGSFIVFHLIDGCYFMRTLLECVNNNDTLILYKFAVCLSDTIMLTPHIIKCPYSVTPIRAGKPSPYLVNPPHDTQTIECPISLSDTIQRRVTLILTPHTLHTGNQLMHVRVFRQMVPFCILLKYMECDRLKS